jgi:hypothetical protein
MMVRTVAFAALIVSACGNRNVIAQIEQDDIVVGLSTSSDRFRAYDDSSSTWSNGPGWSPAFLRSIEFDNHGGISHNAAGNLLAADFGGGFNGFELHNLATNGSPASQVLWNIVEATGGTKGVNPMGNWLSVRGGGISVSPDNRYLAWTTFESPEADGSGGAAIFVHDYAAGPTTGTGGGASISGPRHTGPGDGNGNAGALSALAVSSTQGTSWLNNTTVISLNGFGELITLDVSGQQAGSEDGTLAGWAPTVMTNWVIANDEILFEGDYTDVEFNPLVDPDHIYASVTKEITSEAELFAYNYNSLTGDITLNTRMLLPVASNGQPRQPRELAFDSHGNLFYSGFAGSGGDNLVMKLPDATNIAGWNAANVEVFYNQTGINSSFNGLDVALSLPIEESQGDYNGDETVDAADYVAWAKGVFDAPTPERYHLWRKNFGLNLGDGGGAEFHRPAPEPGSGWLAALGAGAIAAGHRRRSGLRLDISVSMYHKWIANRQLETACCFEF